MGKVVGGWVGPAPPWRRACAACGRAFETNVHAKAACSPACSAARRREADALRRQRARLGLPPAGRPFRLGAKVCGCGATFAPRSGRQLKCDPCRGKKR